ncbi:TetR/AcrR family transcriptional regulator [Clostridium sp.]|jgi:AcrR family transcriptional regulator|uniref:TetR/AcrR family transcriptional regulator n=1 Tax=Clostridium sp. TaxID=1506 RepID=UPI003EE97482
MTTREKIIMTANELFLSEGFANVSIKKITDGVGIGKATFYHHFKTKENLMDIYLEDMVKHFDDNINAELENSNMTITQKIDRLFEILISSKLENTEFNTEILNNFKTYYSISNYVYLETMEKFSLIYFAPIFSNVIREGKLFDDTHNVDKISRMILRLSFIFSKENVAVLTANQGMDKNHIKSEIMSYAYSYRMMIERLLGLTDNSLKQIDISNYLYSEEYDNSKKS